MNSLFLETENGTGTGEVLVYTMSEKILVISIVDDGNESDDREPYRVKLDKDEVLQLIKCLNKFAKDMEYW